MSALLHSVNPATGAKVGEYAVHSAAAVAERIEVAQRAFAGWSAARFAERGRVLRRAAEILRARKAEFAALMADEMGKVLKEGGAEIEKCAYACDYYAEHAESFLSDTPVAAKGVHADVVYRPLGVILAVMPWNFPFWQVFRFAAPNLMAGNVGVLKHASNVSGCALAIADIFAQAGVPEGCFSTLLLSGSRVAEVIAHPHVRAVTLTGSAEAGAKVAAAAGAHLKKTVLELGGSDPYIVLEDADIALAAKVCAQSRLLNAGQSCIAAKRFLVHAAVKEEFTQAFVARMAEVVVGDPHHPASDIGPLARLDLRDGLHAQVERSVEAGARLLLGGVISAGVGAYYPPTVLADVTPGMAAFDEELFGPVAALVMVRDEAEAVALANQSRYGLGAAIFTRDRARGERLARLGIESGQVCINKMVASDPHLPFGGVKDSGYGRELGGWGIREFMNVKTIGYAA